MSRRRSAFAASFGLRWIACSLLLIAAFLGHPATAQAQSSSCSTTYDPAKSYCIPAYISPWRWTWFFSSAIGGPFASEAEADANALATKFNRTAQSWCTISITSTNYDTSAPITNFGVVSVRSHTVHLDAWEYIPACNIHSTSSTFRLEQRRDINCPPPLESSATWSLHSATATVKAYCSIPWTAVFDRCPKIVKGNPCDALTGIKMETEVDYRSGGNSNLQFVRTYDSAAAYQGYAGGSYDEHFTPLGIGWSATYFQKVIYVSDTASVAGAFVSRPDGRRILFNETGGQFVAAPGTIERLTKLTNGSGALTGWTFVTARDETETYNASGQLLSITDRGGHTQTLSYANGPYPVSVSDEFGRTLTFAYDTFLPPRVASVTLPDGNHISFTYDANQNLKTVTYADGKSKTYLYGMTGINVDLLTGINDENAIQYATWTYSSGRVTSSSHAGNVEHYTFAYPSASTRTVTDPLGQSRTYGSSVRRGLRLPASLNLVTTGSSEAKTESYNDNGNVTSRTDFNNIQTTYSYDLARSLETSRTEAVGTPRERTIVTTWDPVYRLPAAITEPNRTTSYTYDGNGNTLTKTITDTSTLPNLSRTWTYTYDSYNRMLTADGPRTDVSDVTTFTYYTCTTGNECGQLQTVTNAAGQVTTYNTYNADGQPLTITDPNGVLTTLTYDLRQRLTSRQVGTEITTFTYWPTGLLKQVTLPDAGYVLYTYDNAHRLTKIQDGDGNRIEYTLDNMGNRTAENAYDPSNALSRTHTRVFNALNQLSSEVNAGGASSTTAFGYDNNGNQTTISAPLSRNTTNQYDELNRLKQITDAGSGITLFGYDANDNLTSVTDPRSKVTSYSFNGFGDLTQQVSPDTGTTANAYDSGGNLQTRTDARGKTGTYAYDALNRVTQIAYPDRTVSFTYDTGTNGVGRLTGASDADHSLAWAYDAQGRVVTKTQIVGAVSKSVSYGYTNGDLTSLTTPSGQVISYGYTNGRVTSVTLNGSTTILNQALYEPFGQVRGWTWGNSTLEARTHDLDGNVSDLESAGSYGFTYDNALRITAITDNADASKSWTYGYDLLDRLTSASKTSQTIGLTYDANGNRLTQTGTTAATYTISGTSNRVSSITGTLARTYAYDAAGNTLGYGGLTFAYQDSGRMSSVTSGSVTTSYVINALGQRVRKSDGSTSRLFVYDEDGHLLGEYDGAGTLIEETVWTGDIPVATLRPNGAGVDVFYVHADHLDTPRQITRPSDNAIVWRWDSDPFGTDAANEDPDGDSVLFAYNLRLPGQYFDAESGLNYNYARDYDPATGRYIESDPIGIYAGTNTYSYVRGNPVDLGDPLGLFVPPPPPPVVPPVVLPATVAACIFVCPAMAYHWYQHNAAKIQDALPHFSPPAPPAANDPDFNDPGCPPDCRQWRESLNRMYHALTRAEEAGLAKQLDVQWRLFRNSVKDYEKQCGKYEPPPSLHDIYTR